MELTYLDQTSQQLGNTSESQRLERIEPNAPKPEQQMLFCAS